LKSIEQTKESPRNKELETIRAKIVDAIRYSPRFWITFREGTFGVASIINLIYKRSYLEVLFFPNSDVIEKGVPLLKIFTPLEEEIDFEEILIDPDFDPDGLVSPRKIIMRMRRLIRRKFQEHLAILDQETRLIEEHFENYNIEKNPYNKEIRVSFPYFNIKLLINFERFPLIPTIAFSGLLSKMLSEKEYYQQEIFKDWDEINPPHIYELVELISSLVAEKLNISPPPPFSQFLKLSNFSVENGLKNVSMKVLKGKSIGIIYAGQEEEAKTHQLDLLNLFEAIRGRYNRFTGSVEIFGNPVQLASTEELNRIFIIPEAYDSKVQTMKIKKAVTFGISIKGKLERKRKDIVKIFNKNFNVNLDSMMKDFLTGTYLSLTRKHSYINNSLAATGLLSKKNKKFNDLTPLEFFQFSISRVLLQSPIIIMFSIPPDLLGKFDVDKFNAYVNKIKEDYHLVVIMHGPEEVISNCDKILTLTQEDSKIGTMEQYVDDLPSSGYVLTLELNNPRKEDMKAFFGLQDRIIIMEERKNEKYKIFIKEQFNEVLVDLTQLFGSRLFSFKKKKATLTECIQYLNVIQKASERL